MKLFKTTKRVVYIGILAGFGVAATFGAVYAYTTGADTVDMLAGDDLFDLNSGNDQIQMRSGNDLFYTGWGSDEISMGGARPASGDAENGVDKFSFYDGNAQLYFHEGSSVSESPADQVYMEYSESTEDLTLRTANDFVIVLGN